VLRKLNSPKRSRDSQVPPIPILPDLTAERRLPWWSFVLFLVGLAIRLYFLAAADVSVPIRGDIFAYWTYAENLVDHAVFSSQSVPAPIPDSFRGPGYPVFLAACMAIANDRYQAFQFATLLQVVLGAAMVPATIAVAKHWLSTSHALVCGLLVALWPHLIVFSSTLLSETLFGLLLLLGTWAVAHADRKASVRAACAGGALFGLAYLVNPLIVLFPLGVSVVLKARKREMLAIAFVLAFAIPVLGWAARNATLPTGMRSSDRALVNLVEGSWPLYHAAHNDEQRDPIARDVANAIRADEALMLRDPVAGLRHLSGSIAADPAYYLEWYLFDKPFLLWDWDIRIGAGGIYFLDTDHSPYERNAAMRLMGNAFRAANPFLVAMACATLLGLLAVGVSRRQAPFALVVTATLAAYLTLVHTILQAEPRYAVAYRPFEVLLAATFLSAALALVRGRSGMRKGNAPDVYASSAPAIPGEAQDA
jgi:hypothetical protein